VQHPRTETEARERERELRDRFVRKKEREERGKRFFQRFFYSPLI
jgi:hypothetical protein